MAYNDHHHLKGPIMLNKIVVKVVAQHALYIGAIAAAATVARDVIVLARNSDKS